jgi:fatty-acid desaturase
MTWSLFIFCFCYYLLAGLVVVIGYHRCLTHKALKLKTWFFRTLIVLGLPAGTPIQWVGNHRSHHMHTDEELDPHSPIVSGFWYAHCGWYINSRNPIICFLYSIAGPIRMGIDAINRPISNQEHNKLARDVAEDKFLNWISEPIVFRCIVFAHLLLPILFTYNLWGVNGVIAWSVTLVIIYNLGDSIDSISHLFGEQLKENEKGAARNNAIIAILTLGDGWHADHHLFPSSAKLGFKKGRIDLSWYIILMLEKLGIASDIKVRKEKH